MCIENGVNVPTLACCYGDQRLIACLSPSPNVFPSFLETSSQCIGRFLVKAVEGITMHVVSHFRLVNVARSSLLRKPKHLVCHLYVCDIYVHHRSVTLYQLPVTSYQVNYHNRIISLYIYIQVKTYFS